jgi:hypothetical protein
MDALGFSLSRDIFDALQKQSLHLQTVSQELVAARAALDERKLVERAKYKDIPLFHGIVWRTLTEYLRTAGVSFARSCKRELPKRCFVQQRRGTTLINI